MVNVNLIFAALFGFVLGILVQRARFCMTGAIRDFILFRIDRNLKMVLLILAVISFFYPLFLTLGWMKPTPMPAGWFSVIGGIIFGIGMAIAGGCVVSTYNRIGEGSINYLITGIMIPTGIVLGAELYKKWADILPGGAKSSLLGSPYGLVWLGDFKTLPPIGATVSGIPLVYFGIIQALIFAVAYIYLERKS
jgi:hypothetical protein